MGIQFKTDWARRLQAAFRRRPAGFAAPARLSPVPANAEWDEAFARVESYLRAHHIESRVLLNQLTTEIVETARAFATERPAEPPVTIAMQVTHARIGEWLVKAIGEGDWADERFRARGRLALLLGKIPQNHPQRFLSPGQVPAEIARPLAEARLQSGPELRVTGMAAAPLEFPLAEAAEEKWETFSRSAFVRASASWLLVIGFLGAAWFAMH
jgi:hypothetical protein